MVVVGEMGLSEAERACVVEAVGAGGEVPERVAREVVDGCVQRETFAPAFVEGLEERFPGRYGEEQLVCLGDGYSELSGEDRQLLVAAGVDPDDEEAEAARGVLRGLFEGCDAPLPEGL